MKITTGDKKVYEPLYRQQDISKELTFNNSVYDFINKEKSFVDRRNMKSRVFPLVVIFQGENYKNDVELFEKSCLDKNYWTIEHPQYGILNGHPLRISFIDSSLNATEVNIDFMETIIDSVGADSDISVISSLENMDELLTEAIKNNFEVVSELEKKGFMDSLNEVRDKYSSLMNNEYLREFQDMYQQVSRSIDSVMSLPQNFISDMKGIIGYAKFVKTDLFRKVDAINSLFDVFISNKSTSKAFKECVCASTISVLAESIVQVVPENNTREEMVVLIDTMLKVYEAYFYDLESSEGYEMKEADYSIQTIIRDMVVTSVYEVYNLISDSKQEISVVTQEDSNIILLTHKYFGLDPEDKNINTFKNINGIKNDKLFIIPRGTTIKYYA